MDDFSVSNIIFLIIGLFFLYIILTNIKNMLISIVDSIKLIFLLLIEATTFMDSDTLDNKIQKLLVWIIFQVGVIVWYFKN